MSNKKSSEFIESRNKSNFASSVKLQNYLGSNTRNVPPFISLNYKSEKLTSKNSFLVIKMKTGSPQAKIVLRISEPKTKL